MFEKILNILLTFTRSELECQGSIRFLQKGCFLQKSVINIVLVFLLLNLNRFQTCFVDFEQLNTDWVENLNKLFMIMLLK